VPSKQELDVYETPAAGGKKIVVHYAGDRSQAQIQNPLLNNKVNFDSKGSARRRGGRSSRASSRSCC
jgi:hypothetical protein